MKSRYWGNTDKHINEKQPTEYSSWKDPHEGIWIDSERFQLLFNALTSWGEGDYADPLASRCFRVSCFFAFKGIQIYENLKIITNSFTKLRSFCLTKL